MSRTGFKDCCVHSFAQKGLRERFKLADPGERHTCETCGRVYRMMDAPPFVWRLSYDPRETERL